MGRSGFTPWLLLVPLAGIAVLVVAAALSSFWNEYSWFRPKPRAVSSSLDQAGIEDLHAVSIDQSSGTRLKGWFRASTNGATVVLLHGSGTDRTAMLPEARMLAGDGFGTLLFDWPGHGESAGRITYGRSELEALDAALCWLVARSDVDRHRIGVLGFSLGGYILAQFAMRDRRVAAFVIEAAPKDLLEHTRWLNRRWGPLSQWPAMFADYLGGVRPALEAVDVTGTYDTPRRASLVIGGSSDPVVPLRMVRDLFDQITGPKELWIIATDRHGGYETAAPEEYPRRLRRFFSDNLRGK